MKGFLIRISVAKCVLQGKPDEKGVLEMGFWPRFLITKGF